MADFPKMENRISSFPDGGFPKNGKSNIKFSRWQISQKWKTEYQIFPMADFPKMENRISNFPDGGFPKNGKPNIKFSRWRISQK